MLTYILTLLNTLFVLFNVRPIYDQTFYNLHNTGDTDLAIFQTKSRCKFYYAKLINNIDLSNTSMESLASVRFFLLLRGNIESNPGPPKIITVNCRGLSSKCKLLSTIGKLRNETKKNESCLIFLQETHLDDYDLITNAWEGTKVIGSFSLLQVGVHL